MHRTSIASFLQFFFLFVLTIPALLAQPADRGDETLDVVNELIESFHQDLNLPGLTVSLMRKGEIVLSRAAGVADLADSTSIKPCCSLFRIGSVVKPMTGVIMMRLVEEGILDIDKPIHEYYPGITLQDTTITCRELATHTAGIRHYKGSEFFSNISYENISDGLQIFAGDSLVAPPGTKYSYTSYGYNLLGVVLEKASGLSFEALLETYIFEPADMDNSKPENPGNPDPLTVRFYTLSDSNEIMACPAVHNVYKLPSGGLLASSEDLLRFGDAVLNGKLLSEASLEESLRHTVLPDSTMSRYGLGWEVSNPESEGPQWFGHAGGSVGGSTFFAIFPEEELIIAAVTNCSGIPVRNLAMEVVGVFLD